MQETTVSERLKKWLDTQHGTAGWEMKLENFILEEISQATQQERERCKYKVLGDLYRNYNLLGQYTGDGEPRDINEVEAFIRSSFNDLSTPAPEGGTDE